MAFKSLKFKFKIQNGAIIPGSSADPPGPYKTLTEHEFQQWFGAAELLLRG